MGILHHPETDLTLVTNTVWFNQPAGGTSTSLEPMVRRDYKTKAKMEMNRGGLTSYRVLGQNVAQPKTRTLHARHQDLQTIDVHLRLYCKAVLYHEQVNQLTHDDPVMKKMNEYVN